MCHRKVYHRGEKHPAAEVWLSPHPTLTIILCGTCESQKKTKPDITGKRKRRIWLVNNNTKNTLLKSTLPNIAVMSPLFKNGREHEHRACVWQTTRAITGDTNVWRHWHDTNVWCHCHDTNVYEDPLCISWHNWWHDTKVSHGTNVCHDTNVCQHISCHYTNVMTPMYVNIYHVITQMSWHQRMSTHDWRHYTNVISVRQDTNVCQI